jgi:hypothetical protein
MRRVAELFAARGIDARREYGRVKAVWREVLKPVKPPMLSKEVVEQRRQQTEVRDGRKP